LLLLLIFRTYIHYDKAGVAYKYQVTVTFESNVTFLLL